MVNGLSSSIDGRRLQPATAIVDEYEAIDVAAVSYTPLTLPTTSRG